MVSSSSDNSDRTSPTPTEPAVRELDSKKIQEYLKLIEEGELDPTSTRGMRVLREAHNKCVRTSAEIFQITRQYYVAALPRLLNELLLDNISSFRNQRARDALINAMNLGGMKFETVENSWVEYQQKRAQKMLDEIRLLNFNPSRADVAQFLLGAIEADATDQAHVDEALAFYKREMSLFSRLRRAISDALTSLSELVSGTFSVVRTWSAANAAPRLSDVKRLLRKQSDNNAI